MRGADALVQALQNAGIDTIFALSGNQIMPVFDAVFDRDIRLIHTRHEAATVHMAEAYAQVSGQIGIALVTAGGGLGNAAGALIAAQASDTPLLLLSGDSPAAQDGQGAFQEMDQTGMTKGLTKASRRITHLDEIVPAVIWALDLAQRDRPGPVHLALPADILTQQSDHAPKQPALGTLEKAPCPDFKALRSSRTPLILLGPALTQTRAPGLAEDLSARLQTPVFAMESPRGLNDPALGRLAQVAAEADYVLCLAKPVDFTLRYGARAQWPAVKLWDVVLGEDAQLETARQNLGSRLGTAISGNPEAIARKMLDSFAPCPDRQGWIKRATDLTNARTQAPSCDAILPQDICRAVQDQIDRLNSATLICDGGEFGQWAQACVQAPKRIINGVSGVIGAGLGYAIGAKAADPTTHVFALMGDGTIGFHLSEFETAARMGLPFVAVIGNDNRWNAEHLIQARSFGSDRHIGCELSAARYDLAVAALGGFGANVTRVDQLEHALDQAVQSQRPACINVALKGLAAPVF